MVSGAYEPIRAIDLEGASGGACWAAGLSRQPWSVDQMRLVGIHVGRDRTREEPRLREVLVGHHIALVARRFRGMHWLLDEYPILEDW